MRTTTLPGKRLQRGSGARRHPEQRICWWAARPAASPDGWWYTLPDSFITAGGGHRVPWRDQGNNSEAVFVATYANRPDQNLGRDGRLPGAVHQRRPELHRGDRADRKVARGGEGGRGGPRAASRFRSRSPGRWWPARPSASRQPDRLQRRRRGSWSRRRQPPAPTSIRRASGRGTAPTSVISARTMVEVLDAGGAVRDTETGLAFDTPPAGSLRFRTTTPLPVSVDPAAGSPTTGCSTSSTAGGCACATATTPAPRRWSARPRPRSTVSPASRSTSCEQPGRDTLLRARRRLRRRPVPGPGRDLRPDLPVLQLRGGTARTPNSS